MFTGSSAGTNAPIPSRALLNVSRAARNAQNNAKEATNKNLKLSRSEMKPKKPRPEKAVSGQGYQLARHGAVLHIHLRSVME